MEPTLLEFYGRAHLQQTSCSPHYSSFMDALTCNKHHGAHITRVLWMRPPETNIMEPTLLEFYGRVNLKQTSWCPHYSSFMDAPI